MTENWLQYHLLVPFRQVGSVEIKTKHLQMKDNSKQHITRLKKINNLKYLHTLYNTF